MGFYLNGTGAYGLFRDECSLPYYIDKTRILEELVAVVDPEGVNSADETQSIKANPKHISLTRLRRFGKSLMANMIASYFGKGIDSSKEFDSLKVASYAWYKKHLNQHNVIHITFNELPRGCKSYEQYISRIERRFIRDLMKAYPDAEIEKDDALWDALTNVYEYCGGRAVYFRAG